MGNARGKYLPSSQTALRIITDQGGGVRVETGVGVGWSRPFWLELESEPELVKFVLLQVRPGVAGGHPAADDDSGRTLTHPPENIERQEEKGSGSV